MILRRNLIKTVFSIIGVALMILVSFSILTHNSNIQD